MTPQPVFARPGSTPRIINDQSSRSKSSGRSRFVETCWTSSSSSSLSTIFMTLAAFSASRETVWSAIFWTSALSCSKPAACIASRTVAKSEGVVVTSMTSSVVETSSAPFSRATSKIWSSVYFSVE